MAHRLWPFRLGRLVAVGGGYNCANDALHVGREGNITDQGEKMKFIVFSTAFLFFQCALLYQILYAKGKVPPLPWWGMRPEIAAAKSLYGKEWRGALKECGEAHLPGDCPLCGAE